MPVGRIKIDSYRILPSPQLPTTDTDWIDWYKQFWDVRLARLDSYLSKTAAKKQHKKK